MSTRFVTRSLACLAAFASCTGGIGVEEGTSVEPTGSGGTGPNSMSGGSGGGPEIASPDTGLRRLTRVEYNNSVRDLLGDSSRPGNLFDVDTVSLNGIFDNDASLLASVELSMDKLDLVAEKIVETALRPNTPSRSKLLTCDPAAGGETCVRSILSGFARRAWRRPVAGDELDRLVAAALGARGDGMEEAVKLGLRMVLASPSFIYRIELDDTKGAHPLNPYELASRLSYFVWASTPDDVLLAAAGETGDRNLASPLVLAAQIQRMLGHGRADAMVENFAVQWLGTRTLADVVPDRMAFPSFYGNGKADARKQAMIAETQLFFRAFLNGDKKDRSVADMLDADFTFANDVLSDYYGLKHVTGTGLQQVPVDGERRFGLLSHAGILTVTSPPTRTNIPRRGKWLLTRLICDPPQEPPANVPTLEAATKQAGISKADPTPREAWKAIADANAQCAGCHSVINPFGFALEHYNGVGAWRATYAKGAAIDASGVLPGGAAFDGARSFSQELKNDPRFLRCFSKMMFRYAFGREPAAPGDQATVDRLGADLGRQGGSIGTLVGLVASSRAFKLRGGVQW